MLYDEFVAFSRISNIPTQEQVWQCYRLCCWATRLYLPIYLIRFDKRTNNIVLLIGDELEFEVKPNGEWSN